MSQNNNPQSISFSLSGNGIIREIKTPCGISEAWDPDKGGSQPQTHGFTSLWDTGATGTVITKNVAKILNLVPSGKAKVFHANGSAIVNTYFVNVYLPNGILVPGLKVTEGDLNGMDVLIGMDIITAGDFVITNFEGKTTFSFRMPSLETIDFVVIEKGKDQKRRNPVKLLAKSDLCGCGSGKPFLDCHGKLN